MFSSHWPGHSQPWRVFTLIFLQPWPTYPHHVLLKSLSFWLIYCFFSVYLTKCGSSKKSITHSDSILIDHLSLELDLILDQQHVFHYIHVVASSLSSFSQKRNLFSKFAPKGGFFFVFMHLKMSPKSNIQLMRLWSESLFSHVWRTGFLYFTWFGLKKMQNLQGSYELEHWKPFFVFAILRIYING